MTPDQPRSLADQAPAGPAVPQAPLPPSRKSILRTLAIALGAVLVFTLFGGLLAALLVHMRVDQQDLLRWQTVSSEIKRWGLLLQCLVVAAIGLWWRAIVDWGARKGFVRQHELNQVIGLRWTVLAFGIAYLILVPIGPTSLWRYLMP